MDKYLLNENGTIQMALDKLSNNFSLGLVVVNSQNTLLGSLTDGDIRRALSSSKSLETKASEVMFKSPKTANQNTTELELQDMTKGRKIKLIPIVENGTVVDVFTVDPDEMKDIPVVLMAGGLGSRLGDLTKDVPKPMLEVGGKPVLERIMENFTRVGFKKFYISVNFKAEVIEDHFKDGSKFNCDITYLKEDKKLGTAGSLGLLPKGLTGPMIVTNGDLLTQVDYRCLVGFHNDQNSKITMCTRKFDIQVPYGVINLAAGKITSMEEKPVHSFNVNAGVYVVDAELTHKITKDEYLDMPTFIENEMSSIDVHSFPMIEKWIDIGKVSDLEFARKLYGESND